MRLILMTAAFVALALGACSSYAPPARKPETFAQRLDARRLDDPAIAALVGTPSREAVVWSLDTLTRAAIYLNPDVEALRAKWRVSQAAIETAGRRPNPSLDASAGRATNPPAGEPPGLADLALGIRVETAGKRAHRIAEAEALSESDRFELEAAAWKLRGRIRDAMLDWQASARQTAWLDKQVDVERSIVRMVEKRVALGEAAMGDKLQADARLSRALVNRATVASRVREAQSRLAQAVGIPLEAIVAARIAFESLDAPKAMPLEGQLRRAALQRGDLRAALARFAAADASYRLELARQYPDLGFGPSYSYDTGTNKFSIGVISLTLPAIDRNQGAIAEARARREEAARRFESMQASLLAELDRATSGALHGGERYALARNALHRARDLLDATSRSFAAGKDDRLALASAQATTYDVERATIAAGLDLHKALGSVEDAAHVGLFGTDQFAGTVIEEGHPR